MDRPRKLWDAKLDNEHMKFIDERMAEDDELMARKLRQLLENRWPGLQVSLSTIKRACRSLGWVATRPKYSQLVREANKEKRVAWCQEQISKGDKFLNVIWADECSVQLDNHGRLCFRRKQEKRKLKPRPKHPLKLHIWAGISAQGATSGQVYQPKVPPSEVS